MNLARLPGLYLWGRKEVGLAAPDEVPALPAGAAGPPPASCAVVFVVGGPIGPADVPGLVDRLGVLLEGNDATLVVCDVATLTDPDAGTIDALARLALTARRHGCRIRLRNAPPRLRELLALTGLGDVLPLPGAALPLEPQGQAEQREQPGRVEEGVEPDDPAI